MTADKINILMVDDQPAKLLSYEVILAGLGENLIKAHSASDALNILLKTDIAVVLMDVSMPDVDGFELADVIRQHPRFQKTAIIFISGVHLADSDKIQGYRSGAVDYISVPVIPEVLRAKVASLSNCTGRRACWKAECRARAARGRTHRGTAAKRRALSNSGESAGACVRGHHRARPRGRNPVLECGR
jgi:CheY-like chemotaxis protein